MAFSSRNYSAAVANLKAVDNTEAQDIIDLLQTFRHGSESTATPRSSASVLLHAQPQITTSRQIVLPANEELDVEKIALLRRVFENEQSLASNFTAIMNDGRELEDAPDRLQALKECAVREMLY